MCRPAADGWAVVLRGMPGRFVDISSPQDDYPEAMWQQAAGYFRSLPAGVTMLGGRLACAQQLAREGLPFFAGRSLGRLCHVVQLAISQRRLLCYNRGRLVPCDNLCSKARYAPAAMRLSTSAQGQRRTAAWPEVVGGIHSLLKTAPSARGVVPLSNVKRLFRSQLHLELDEAALGCEKLSAVFERLTAERQCELQQQPGGLVIAPVRSALPKLLGSPRSHPTLGSNIHKHARDPRRIERLGEHRCAEHLHPQRHAGGLGDAVRLPWCHVHARDLFPLVSVAQLRGSKDADAPAHAAKMARFLRAPPHSGASDACPSPRPSWHAAR